MDDDDGIPVTFCESSNFNLWNVLFPLLFAAAVVYSPSFIAPLHTSLHSESCGARRGRGYYYSLWLCASSIFRLLGLPLIRLQDNFLLLNMYHTPNIFGYFSPLNCCCRSIDASQTLYTPSCDVDAPTTDRQRTYLGTKVVI